MAAIKIKGFIHEIHEKETITTAKGDQMQVRNLDVREPAYVDEFGEKKGQDTIYRIKLFKEAEEKFPAIGIGAKVIITAYVNSKEFKRDTEAIDYNTYLVLKSVEIVQ